MNLLGIWTLARRELTAFLRQRSRVIGALVPPIVFWFLIGSGLGSSFSRTHYLHFFFPGTVMLIVLFTAIFSTISLIEDRKAGFLQGVLVAPSARGSIVFGKILGGTILALGHGGLFLALAPVSGVAIPIEGWPAALGLLVGASLALTALGFWLAWRLESSQGFHAIMNLLLIPMWLLSGALFPVSGASSWVVWLMRLNPLSHAVQAFQSCFFAHGVPLESYPIGRGLMMTWIFAAAMLAMAWHAAARERVR